MSTIKHNTTTPRPADIWGLALAAARQQKVRTALTIIGVVVGTFTLVVSLSVGQGVEQAIVALFHEDDRLRKVAVQPKYQPSAADVPESEREPRGSMSEAKRERIRRALVRNWRGVSHWDRRVRLDAAALSSDRALDHVVRVEPVVQGFGTATLGEKKQNASACSLPAGSRFLADRLLAGRIFKPEDGRVAIVHEYLLYRWGLVSDHEADAALGRTFRMEYRSSPRGSLHLSSLLDDIGAVEADKKPALESGLRRLAAVVRFLPIPRDERDALATLFDRIPATSATRAEQTVAETFTIVGVVRERDENGDDTSQASPFGEWHIGDTEILLPPQPPHGFTCVRPTRPKRGSTRSL